MRAHLEAPVAARTDFWRQIVTNRRRIQYTIAAPGFTIRTAVRRSDTTTPTVHPLCAGLGVDVLVIDVADSYILCAMAKMQKYRWRAVATMVFSVAATCLWLVQAHQTSNAQGGTRPNGPLISRGYTEAPAGSVIVAGEAEAGSTVLELSVVDGQKIKRGDLIAILSGYTKAEVMVRTTEAALEKDRRGREAMVSGPRTAEIAMQEVVIKGKAEELKLKNLEVARSGKTPEMRQLEINISEQDVAREQAKLRFMKETLETDLARIENDILITTANLDSARFSRDQAMIRSPIDGVVVQIYSRRGERVAPLGVVKVVDMGQLRVVADVDELHLGRVVLGGKVEVSFRGSTAVYRGKISRVAPTVKRMQRLDPEQGSSMDSRVIQVEIELDDPASMPQVVGRETRVTFL